MSPFFESESGVLSLGGKDAKGHKFPIHFQSRFTKGRMLKTSHGGWPMMFSGYGDLPHRRFVAEISFLASTRIS
jgi:hypothetical protein